MSHLDAEQEGDQVAEFQQLCEVQSDKASVEITSQYEGTVTRLLYSEGDIVQVRLRLSCASLQVLLRTAPAAWVMHLMVGSFAIV